MFKNLKLLIKKGDVKNIIYLIILSLLFTVIETTAATIFIPFLTILNDTNVIQNNDYIYIVYNFFEFDNNSLFVVFFSASLIVFYIIRALFTIFYQRKLYKFAFYKYEQIANKVYLNLMRQTYMSFTDKNPSEMMKIITTEVNNVSSLIINALTFISELLIVIFIFGILFYLDATIASAIILIIAIILILMKLTVSKKIKNFGSKRESSEKILYNIINETLMNFKFIKVSTVTSKITSTFNKSIKSYSNINTENNVLQQLPRIWLEASGLLILLSMTIYLVLDESGRSPIDMIAIYAMAFFRVLPAITRITNSYNNMLFHHRSLDIVAKSVVEIDFFTASKMAKKLAPFNKSIRLENISFRHSESKKNLFNNFNLEIFKGSKVAIFGPSGYGKSTLVDIISGLIQPNSGNIFVDDELIGSNNIESWMSNIGYIPQDVILTSGSIMENIVFYREYDENKAIRALKMANIYDFVLDRGGCHQLIGSFGVKISGGQRQRLGIARALYTDPSVLIMDESTSALDKITEAEIMNEIYTLNINTGKTLLIIAHRKEVIDRCNVIIDLEELEKAEA